MPESERIKLERIRDEIIEKAFPELKEEKIVIDYRKLYYSFFDCGRLPEGRFYLWVDESLKGVHIDILKGGIAHDLVHILSDKEQDKSASTLDFYLYGNWERYRILDERNTDLGTIIRGYGEELLLLMKYTENNGHPYIKDDGLSIREIEIILSLGKPK